MIKIFKIIFILFLSLFCCSCQQAQKTPAITFSTWGSQSEINVIKPLIKKFEEENQVKVNLLHIPQNYFQKLHLLFASNQAPDVLFLNNYYLKTYQKANLLTDLTRYFSDTVNSDNYFKNAIDSLTIDSKLYAIPRDISNMVVFYNKNLFDKYKIKYPDENWSYEDFNNIAQKFKKNNIYAISFEEHPLFWEPILWANGGELFNKNEEFILNKQQNIEALKYYIELKTKYNFAPSKEFSANKTMAQMFLNEEIAMQISGRWLVPKYRQEAKFDWDVTALPTGAKGTFSASDASGWAISSTTQNLDLALKLVQFLSSKESTHTLTETGLITPARRDVANSSVYLNTNLRPKNAIVFIKNNYNAKINTIPDNYNKKVEKLIKQLEPYFLGKEKITPYTRFEL